MKKFEMEMEIVWVYDPDVNCGCCNDNTEVNVDTGLCRECERCNRANKE